ncbi:hypothetical protein FB446DRAFT_702705 [Lentinula raphanica]|nr:hypothetical protein FB446DRAFT_702705 [Lentinula raphanica]
MEQGWRLINIDRKEASGLGKLRDFFFYSDYDSNVVDYLTPLVLYSNYKSDMISLEESFQRFAQTNRNMASTGILLARLPIELVLLIVEHLRDDYLSLLCLSLTCTFFWDITGQARYHSLTSAVNEHSWAGDRIILLGDLARSLPPSMLLDNDVDELRLNGRSDTLAEALYDAARDFPEPSRMKRTGPLYDTRVIAQPQLHETLWKLQQRYFHLRHWIWFHSPDFKLRSKQNPGARWMVRNLSKREYVTKASSRDLVSLIYYLIRHSDDGTPWPGDGWLTRGPWAGDRIDLTFVSIHQQEYGNESDWKDVTARV